MNIFEPFPGMTSSEKVLLNEFLRNGGNTWQAPTLANSWVNAGGSNVIARFKKDFWNRVWCEGTIKDGTKTDGTVIFTFPAGYRPAYDIVIPAFCSDNVDNFACNLAVRTNGQVQIYEVSANSWLGFTFSFEAVA